MGLGINNAFKTTLYWALAALAYLLYRYFSGDFETTGAFFEEDWIYIYVSVFVLPGIFFAVYETDQSWASFKQTFKETFSGEVLTDLTAIGTLRTREIDHIVENVVTALAPEGILVFKPKKKLLGKHGFLIPWSRVMVIQIKKPDSFSKVNSETELEIAMRMCSAELRITRGDYPSYMMSLPWHLGFRPFVPKNVKQEDLD